MARTEIERTVLPSLLDRLTDDAPRTPADPPLSREESVRRFRAAVLRDVEWLLNTRRTPIEVPAALVLVRGSVFAYGFPDTTGVGGTHEGRQQLARWVEETVAAYEPRLADVRVAVEAPEDRTAARVRFTLSALLRMDPSPERVLFDTVLDLASGGYAVHDGAAGAEPAAGRGA